MRANGLAQDLHDEQWGLLLK